jgi:hypothetical protein
MCISRTGVCLGKFTMVRSTLFCRHCNLIRWVSARSVPCRRCNFIRWMPQSIFRVCYKPFARTTHRKHSFHIVAQRFFWGYHVLAIEPFPWRAGCCLATSCNIRSLRTQLALLRVGMCLRSRCLAMPHNMLCAYIRWTCKWFSVHFGSSDLYNTTHISRFFLVS